MALSGFCGFMLFIIPLWVLFIWFWRADWNEHEVFFNDAAFQYDNSLCKIKRSFVFWNPPVKSYHVIYKIPADSLRNLMQVRRKGPAIADLLNF